MPNGGRPGGAARHFLTTAVLGQPQPARAQDGPFVYASNVGGNNITGIDSSTNAAFPIEFSNSSQGLIVSSDGSHVYTSDYLETNTVTILSTADNSVQHILLEASMGSLTPD